MVDLFQVVVRRCEVLLWFKYRRAVSASVSFLLRQTQTNSNFFKKMSNSFKRYAGNAEQLFCFNHAEISISVLISLPRGQRPDHSPHSPTHGNAELHLISVFDVHLWRTVKV
jgi:hypothetical protein